MSFVLPGNARQLRFTGEAKALTPATANTSTTGAVALGKPRVRKPSVPAGHIRTPVPPPATARVSTPAPGRRLPTPPGGDVYRNDVIPTPYVPSINPPIVRHKQDSFDDENPTMALDRDALDVMPGGNTYRSPRPSPAGAAPIPHFRTASPSTPASALAVDPAAGTGSNSVRFATGGAPLAVWIAAGILAGVLSYFVAPEIMARLESPAHAAQSR
ncbi:MAG: hypothetical protein KF764_32070 [Labilithrix sp.]|nr:hypothetical protein [Labilithrix sp.]MBX3224157.1 hypothetical protein [Labilithrix sp.]